MDEEKEVRKGEDTTESGPAQTDSMLNTVARAVGSALGAVAAKAASVVESAEGALEKSKPVRAGKPRKAAAAKRSLPLKRRSRRSRARRVTRSVSGSRPVKSASRRTPLKRKSRSSKTVKRR